MGCKSGVPGIYWEVQNEAWRVCLLRKGKRIYVGMKKDLDEAVALQRSAEAGESPSDEERQSAVQDRMARIRLRAVWREVVVLETHGWSSFDHFVSSVWPRPKSERKLVAKDVDRPIGPDNFEWVAPVFDHSTEDGKNAYQRAHRADNLDHYRDKELRRNFGIDLTKFREMMSEQSGGCAICGNPETAIRQGRLLPLSVDHNHTTGSVRGLLCTACNIGIGSLAENPERLRAAIAYLERWKAIETAPLPDNVVRLKDDKT
jgi:hypothetical protein